MAVYDQNGRQLFTIYDQNGRPLDIAYNANDEVVFTSGLPVPSGTLTASEIIPLPDLYEAGRGFTCTGLTSDGTYYYIGDIGTLTPSGSYHSQIVVTEDFSTVSRIIPLPSGFGIIQGISLASDGTFWCADAQNDKIWHVDGNGDLISTITINDPTGIFWTESGIWVLTYQNKIKKITETGQQISSADFTYSETPDQCFLDSGRGILYMTAGENYTGANNLYAYNINTGVQYIACILSDSYSVEGIWIEPGRMIVLNDGYYHSATVPVNQANIYTL